MSSAPTTITHKHFTFHKLSGLFSNADGQFIAIGRSDISFSPTFLQQNKLDAATFVQISIDHDQNMLAFKFRTRGTPTSPVHFKLRHAPPGKRLDTALILRSCRITDVTACLGRYIPHPVSGLPDTFAIDLKDPHATSIYR